MTTHRDSSDSVEDPTAQETIPGDEVSTEPTEGLTSAEASRRLEQSGYNEIPEVRRSALLAFLGYFWGPIPWMIEAAAALSAADRRWEDLGIILVLLFMNAIVGFWEEYQAGNAIDALKAKLSLQARVRRDREWRTIPARELVPGDLVRLRIGEIVPADAKLQGDSELEIDQSLLTGESLPVTRGEGEDVYSGSVVKRGESEAIVGATGTHTYFGKTAYLVETAHTVSHFQRAVLKIGNFLIVLAVALVALIIAVSILRSQSLSSTLQFSLVLIVAGIPVAMPTVLSVTMAVGARILARKEAIVTRLAAIEEMAGIDVLCSDKTGTLTQNQLTLGNPFALPGVDSEDVVLAGALASTADGGDLIDTAVVSGLKDPARLKQYRVVHFLPFDPVIKHTEAAIRDPEGHEFKVAKGAPQVILEMIPESSEVTEPVTRAVDGFASRGFRSLGVARADEGGEWRYLGVLPLFDPPREDAAETIEAARRLGLDVKMVTGDQVAIGREIAKSLDLGTDIVDATLLADASKDSDEERLSRIEAADGFAQVYPEHKFALVEILQSRGHIVGMTGDGVNDAPALKQADAGIAVSGATDAARAAADIALLAPGLGVIIDAVEEARKIFQRMTSYAIYRIAETIRVLLLMSLAIIALDFYPVTAIMIVLLALLNDGAILSIAYDRAQFSEAPEHWDMPRVLGVASALGVAGVIASFTLFFLADEVFELNRDTIQTLIYLKLSVAGHLTIFLTRTRRRFWQDRPSWILIGAVIGTQCVATLIAVYGFLITPIGWEKAGIVWAYALAWFLVNDQVKLAAYAFLEKLRPDSEQTTQSPAKTAT
jgi:H+-transporting ATPase